MNQPNKLTLISLLIIFSLACGLGDRLSSNGEQSTESTPTRTPMPTFTTTPSFDTIAVVPTATNTDTPVPTPTPIPPTDTPVPPEPTATPNPAPQVSLAQTVNVRTGPSTAYPRIGQVTSGHISDILGRNNDASWVLINFADGQGWVYASLTQIEGDVNNAPVIEVDAPPPSPPTATPKPPAPQPQPSGSSYPFRLTNMFGEKNEGITQVRGYIKDASGQPMNGIRVRVRSGSFCTVSYPSGPPGNYPPGNYDILLDGRAKSGNWLVAVVDRPTNPENTKCDPAAQQLSEEVTAKTTNIEGVTYVEWQKN